MLKKNMFCLDGKCVTWRSILIGWTVVCLSVMYFALGASAVTKQAEDDGYDRGVDEARSYCGYYVKPATCLSHGECRWTGSCVPR